MSKKIFICDFCSKSFSRYENIKRPSKNYFCSKVCSGNFQSKYFLGENNPNYKGRDLDKICHCGLIKDLRSKCCSKCEKKSFSVGMKEIFREEKKNLIIEKQNFVNSISDLAKLINVDRGLVKKLLIELYGKIPGHFKSGKSHHQDESFIFTITTKRRNGVVKAALIRSNKIEYKCSWCHIGPEWNNKKLGLELDHCNGNPLDNRIENLRFLCPNCHSQTETSKGKNCKNVRRK